MNKLTITNILLIFAAFLIISCGIYYIYGGKGLKKERQIEIIHEDLIRNEIILRGMVTDERRGCEVDGTCSFVLGDYEVVWAVGWSHEPVGSKDIGIQKGERIEVFGKKEGESRITIYGSQEYYIKKIMQ